MRHRQTGRLARRPAAGLSESVAAHLRQRCPVVAKPVAEPRVAEGKVDADAMPCRAECVGHGHGCADPAEWVKEYIRRGRRSGLRAGAGACPVMLWDNPAAAQGRATHPPVSTWKQVASCLL